MAPNILFEVSPKKPDGTSATLWMSHASADSSGTQLDGKEWKPLVTKRPTISLELMDSAGNQADSVVKRGAIEFRLGARYQNRDWAAYTWADAPAKLWVGELGRPFSAYIQILDGSVSTLSLEKGLASVELLGPDGVLDIDLLSKAYAGTGGEEGPKEMEGALKPWCSGTVKNISPVLVDPARYIYQVHGYGPVADIATVYDIQPLDPGRKTVVQTYTELVALTMTPGDWAVCLPLGMVRIGGAVMSGLQADVTGATFNGTTPTTIATIIPHLLSLAGVPPTKVGSFAQFTTAQWGAYFDSQETLGDVIRDAMTQAGGYIVADGTGVWQSGDFYAAKTPTVLKSDRSSLPLVRADTIKEANAANPAWSVSVGYDRCWTVLGDIATSAVLNDALTTVGEVIPAIQAGLGELESISDQVGVINAAVTSFAEDNLAFKNDLAAQAWTNGGYQIGLFNEKTARIQATRIDGEDVAPVVRRVQTVQEGFQQTIEKIGQLTPDGSGFIFNSQTVKWDGSTTFAQKFAQLSATQGDATAALAEERAARVAGDAAEAEAREQLEAALGENIGQTLTDAKTYTDQLRTYTTTNFTTLSTFNANKAAVDISISTLTNSLSSESGLRIALANTVEANRATAAQDTNTVATNLSAEVTARQNFQSTFNNYKASVDSSISTLTNAKDAQAGLLTQLRTDVDGNQALAVQKYTTFSNDISAQVAAVNLLNAQMAGTNTNSYLYQRSNLGVSQSQAAIDTLNQMGATLGNGGAFIMLYSKIVAADGTTLATDIASLKATLGNKSDKSYVDAQITAARDVAAAANSATARDLTTVSTTVGQHTSSISQLIQSTNGISARYGVSLDVNGYVQGFQLIGGTGAVSDGFYVNATKFVVGINGVNKQVFSIGSDGVTRMADVEVDRFKANSVITDTLVANSVSNRVRSSAQDRVAGTGGEVLIFSHSINLARAADVRAQANVAFGDGGGNNAGYHSSFLRLRINGEEVNYNGNGGANATQTFWIDGSRNLPAGTHTVELYGMTKPADFYTYRNFITEWFYK